MAEAAASLEGAAPFPLFWRRLAGGRASMTHWDDAEDRVERARQLFEQRKWAEALDELRAAVAINPYNAAWFFNMGQALDELERFDEAAVAYRQALDLAPEDLNTANQLGIALCHLGRLGQALRVFDDIQRQDPAFEPAYCNRIAIHTQLGQHEKAEEMFYLARLYRDHCPQCYHNIGLSLADRGQHLKAIYCWQRALDIDSEQPECHIRIAESHRALGQLEQARRHYVIGLRHDPGNLDTLLDLGQLLGEMGHSDEAGEKFRRAIELAPTTPAAYLRYGRWLMLRGETDLAADHLHAALRHDPAFPGIHLRLAEIYQQRGQARTARRHLRKEVQLHPQDPDLLADLGAALLDSGETRAAAACLKRLVTLRPDEPAAWQALAVAQFARRQFDAGIASCRRALQGDPHSPITLYNLALACEHLGDYAQARSWSRLGLHHHPGDVGLQRLDFRLAFLARRARIMRYLRSFLGI